MPLIRYLCSCEKSISKFFRSTKDVPGHVPCECGLEMKKQLSAPGNASKITVDNGVQAKSVEIDLNVIQSNLENSTKDFSKK